MADNRLRGPDGRWLKGDVGGPGRPKRVTEQAYMESLTRAVSPSGLAKAAKKMLALAEAGDVQAFKVLVAYAIGTPIQRIEAKLDQRSVSLEVQAMLQKVYGDDDGD